VNSLFALLRFLCMYLNPGQDPGEPGDALPDQGDPPPEHLVDDDRDPGEDDETPGPPEEPPARPNPELERAQQRIRDLEQQIAQPRPPAAPAIPPGQDAEARLHAQEEARLADPGCTDLERWQIGGNRMARANARTSQEALAHARGASDMAQYNMKAAQPANTKLYTAYRDRVEAVHQQELAKGNFISREMLLWIIIGKDHADGKFRVKKPAQSNAGSSQTGASGQTGGGPSHVARGSSPAVRSDVNARGGAKTESQKRLERLDGVII